MFLVEVTAPTGAEPNPQVPFSWPPTSTCDRRTMHRRRWGLSYHGIGAETPTQSDTFFRSMDLFVDLFMHSIIQLVFLFCTRIYIYNYIYIIIYICAHDDAHDSMRYQS